jgi:hypothetical protein
VTREQVIERLRVWAVRAQSEAQRADTPADVLNWTGQAQVLSGIAEFLASQGAQLDPASVRLQVVTSRQKSIGAWEHARDDERALAQFAGEVTGYDLALSLLKDAGQSWTG